MTPLDHLMAAQRGAFSAVVQRQQIALVEPSEQNNAAALLAIDKYKAIVIALDTWMEGYGRPINSQHTPK